MISSFVLTGQLSSAVTSQIMTYDSSVTTKLMKFGGYIHASMSNAIWADKLNPPILTILIGCSTKLRSIKQDQRCLSKNFGYMSKERG